MSLTNLQLSPSTRYALCGMAYLANQPATRYALVEEISAAENLPRHFLAKIFQQLAQRGFLTSRRGPGGGYALSRASEKVSLLDVLSALEPNPVSGFCFLENRACEVKHPCIMHDAATAAGTLMIKALQKMTLADLRHPKRKTFHV